MTGKERYITTLRGGKPDRLPLHSANNNAFLTHYYGITPAEYLHQPARAAEALTRFAREFRFDSSLAGGSYILYGCGPELGVTWEWAEGSYPAAVKGPLQEEEDLARIEVPAEPSGYFRLYLEMLRVIEESLGDEIYVTASILGPFTVACFLRGLEPVMLDTKLNLPFFHRYMAKCTELSTYFAGHVLAALKHPFLNEIYLTPEMMSPRFYHENVAPYDDEVGRRFQVPNPYSTVMGPPEGEAAQRSARYAFDAKYGTQDSLDALVRALDHPMPGLPFFVTVSGRMLVTWPKEEILAFVARGVELVRERGRYPAISLASVQPPSPESARDVAEKLRAIGELRDGIRL